MYELTWEQEQNINDYLAWQIDNDWATKGAKLMPQTMVKETTVYTLEELEALGWRAHETALTKVMEWNWEGWEPSWYSDDIAYFVKEEFPLFDMERTSLEWSTNPDWVHAKGEIDLRQYMKAQKLHTKMRALWYAIDVLGLESTVVCSFGYGESPDLDDLRRGVDYDIDNLKYDSARYQKLHAQVDALEKDIDNYLDGIESRLLSNLREEIDWQYSEEHARETIEANEFVFTENGDIYHG